MAVTTTEYIQNFNVIEDKLVTAIGKNYFAFIAPGSIDPQFIKYTKKIRKKFAELYKEPQIKTLIDEYLKINTIFTKVEPPLLLEFEGENIPEELSNFLLAQHRLQQARWYIAQKEYAIYGLEFFIRPLSQIEQQEAEHISSKQDLTLDQTLFVTMPFALKTNKTGEFAMGSTITAENEIPLIRSKLSGLKIVEFISQMYFHKLFEFDKWALFAITNKDLLIQIAFQIIQAIYDDMVVFGYEQIQQGIQPPEVKINAQERLNEIIKAKKLEEIIVYRNTKPMPLANFVLEILTQIRKQDPNIVPQLIKDLYTHIFKMLNQILEKNYLSIEAFYAFTLREASNLEKEQIENEYTLEISPITQTGQLLSDIKELYAIRLSPESIETLIVQSTNKHKLKHYYL